MQNIIPPDYGRSLSCKANAASDCLSPPRRNSPNRDGYDGEVVHTVTIRNARFEIKRTPKEPGAADVVTDRRLI